MRIIRKFKKMGIQTALIHRIRKRKLKLLGDITRKEGSENLTFTEYAGSKIDRNGNIVQPI